MISVKDLTVRYPGSNGTILALDRISLDIGQGDILAVIGPSGCGKSTIINTLCGIVNSYEGEVSINSQPVNPKTHRIGLIPQNYGLLPWETVYKNIVLGLKIRNHNDAWDMEFIEHILEKLGIVELKERYPALLSGGEKQRVAIARSFVLKPELLLMDEPFSALDAISREEAQDLFLQLWDEYKVSTVFVTHSIEEAVYTGKKIAVLSPSPGRIMRMMDNPVFGMPQLRLRSEYYDICVKLRSLVKEVWSKNVQ